MKIRCLIIDDEPIARQILEGYCAHFPEIEVVASCGNAFDAKQWIQQQTIYLIFLDINMPVLDGLAFMRTLRNPPEVIFTTAYKEFAHEAFDINACDYLLKPFSLERFIISVDKAKERLQASTSKNEEPFEEDFAYVKSDGKIYKVQFDELQYTEASGNHVKLVTANGLILSTMTFDSLEKILPKSKFIRIHRSFIVNKSKISHIDGNRVFIGTIEIPIGSTYREAFFREIGVR